MRAKYRSSTASRPQSSSVLDWLLFICFFALSSDVQVDLVLFLDLFEFIDCIFVTAKASLNPELR